ncbi:CinA family protein [Saccharospirillum mangrovi]|uniref:CinA family protein n=1 Tax=Saccharospirillum mangrovi TaxID=2161747 RepID=UPI000D3AC4E3|nr:CinA family protein [Saccharospirillum mangrovi]
MARRDDQVERLATLLLARSARLATVESCTGGLIAAAITDKAGSSDWFEGGWVTYSNELKQALGVPAAALRDHGAVSESVARAMALAGQQQAGVEYAVAVTGVAGPGGGSAEKPVGTVWIGWAFGRDVQAKRFLFPGDRAAVRQQTVEAALSGLIESLEREI